MGVPCGKSHGWEPHSWSLKPPPRVSLMAQAALEEGEPDSHTLSWWGSSQELGSVYLTKHRFLWKSMNLDKTGGFLPSPPVSP